MAGPPRAQAWLTARGALTLDVPRIMGIVNVTPDSFHDGGQFPNADAAITRAGELLAAGADILDIGGESTRPGAQPVTVEEELRRVQPVIRGVLTRWPAALISIDTVKAEVAAAALAGGAAIVNDVSGLRLDTRIADVAVEARAGLVLMHSRGTVADMAGYELAVYGTDPVAEIVGELAERTKQAKWAGVEAEQIVVDPGLGFSKRTEHSVAAIAGLEQILGLGYPVLLGPSRKRFIGELSGGLASQDRLEGTLAACVAGLLHGARIFRVHDVQPVRRALEVAEAILRAGP